MIGADALTKRCSMRKSFLTRAVAGLAFRWAMLPSRHTLLFAAIVSSVLAFSAVSAVAKRTVPGAVESVTTRGITYSAPAAAMGFVVASDASSHRELWRKRIYRI